MRIDVEKFLFLGPSTELEQFFQKAQKEGYIHFIDSGKIKEVPEEIGEIQRAIKITLGLPITQQVEPEFFYDANRITHEILEIKNKIERLEEDERLLRIEIARIHIFGDYDTKDIERLQKETSSVVQFFVATKDAIENVPPEMFYAGSDHGLDYFFTISDSKKSYEKMTEMIIDKPLSFFREKLKEVQHQHQESIHELKRYQKYNTYLHHYLNLRLNHYNRLEAEKGAEPALDGHIFSIAGWVPTDRVKDLDKLVEGLDITHEQIAIEPNDKIPTYLENRGVSLLGEDLVHIYDTPSSQDRDPSLWVLFAFMFFFAFIMNDAGYGLLLLLLFIFLWFKLPYVKDKIKRFFKLGMLLAVATIIWGVLTNSFFGLTVPFDSPFRKLSVMNYLIEKQTEYHMHQNDEFYQDMTKLHPELKEAKTPQEFMTGIKEPNGEVSHEISEKIARTVLLEAALLVGVIHLILSFTRNMYRNYSGIGWIMFLIGGFLYFPVFLNAQTFLDYIFHINRQMAGEVGLYLLIGGIIVATVIAIIQHKWLGLLEPAHAIQVFADVMSYLRLYALGLAGAIVAITINDMAHQLPIVVAVFLFIVAHIVNLLLSIMGATIHGLRLNFLEWYRHSFEGGGRLFSPLKLFKIE
jgi:V/A-type H+-transporting ATPase subunit I